MTHGLNYKTEKARKQEVDALSRFMNSLIREPLTQYEINQIISNQLEKVRRDIKNLRKDLKTNEL